LLNFCDENKPESDSFGAQIVNFSLNLGLKHGADGSISARQEPVFASKLRIARRGAARVSPVRSPY
jgi:hypothetical protein